MLNVECDASCRVLGLLLCYEYRRKDGRSGMHVLSIYISARPGTEPLYLTVLGDTKLNSLRLMCASNDIDGGF